MTRENDVLKIKFSKIFFDKKLVKNDFQKFEIRFFFRSKIDSFGSKIRFSEIRFFGRKFTVLAQKCEFQEFDFFGRKFIVLAQKYDSFGSGSFGSEIFGSDWAKIILIEIVPETSTSV